MTIELAPVLLMLDVVVVGALIALGALEHTEGVVGLACQLVSAAVAVPLILRARRTVVDIGPVVQELDPAESVSPYPRHHILFPLLAMRRRGVRFERGVEFWREGNLRLKLDAYMPASPPDGPRPAIVQVHGGGWVIGSRREQAIPLLTHMAANGWVGFNIDYRLSPRATWPDHIVDVKRAIAWVREHADEYGVDPSFIVITGGSAGGHLSALAAVTANDPAFQPGFEDADTSVAAAAPFYGIYDMLDGHYVKLVHRVLDRQIFKTRKRDDPEPFRAASPLYRVHPDVPPMFVVHGERDSMIYPEEARTFVAALREVSREPVLYAEMKGAQHAFDMVASWRTIPIVEAMERFFTTVYNRRSQPPERVERDLEEAL